MKKIIVEEKGEGLMKLLGQRVTFYCTGFIYCGDLVGVNETCVLLENAEIVYETGAHGTANWASAEKLPNGWYIQTSAIESFGIFKK